MTDCSHVKRMYLRNEWQLCLELWYICSSTPSLKLTKKNQIQNMQTFLLPIFQWHLKVGLPFGFNCEFSKKDNVLECPLGVCWKRKNQWVNNIISKVYFLTFMLHCCSNTCRKNDAIGFFFFIIQIKMTNERIWKQCRFLQNVFW